MTIIEFWLFLGIGTLAIGTILYLLDGVITKWILRRHNND